MKRLIGLVLSIALCLGGSSFARGPERINRAGSADPSRNGPYDVEQFDYRGGYATLRDPTGVPIAQELHGTIYLPQTARGHLPLVLLLHGRHSTCEYADRLESFGYPCPEAPPATADVSSFRGYASLASNLASHGFVVASLDANAINSYDIALVASDNGMRWRAELVAQTLDLFSTWNEETGPEEIGDRLLGKIDFGRIGLMGHSRGGEGVAQFVKLNRERTDGPTYEGLRAVFALAPTDFYANKVNGVHFGTIVPLCDGDVYNLQGAWMFDDARFLKPDRYARVQFAINGANHNFFNTIWTFDDGVGGGDDTGNNPGCDPDDPASVRLSAAAQRRLGLGLMASFFRRYVAGEKVFDPLMTGAGQLPVCPGPLTCRRTVMTSFVAPASDRKLLLEPSADGEAFRTTGGVDASLCKPDLSGQGCPSAPNRSPARQLTLSWTSPGSLSIELGRGTDLRAFDALSFRTAVNFSDPRNNRGETQAIEVVLIDTAGERASVNAADYSAALDPPAGPEHLQMLLNGVWIPLGAFQGVDLSRLTALELRVGEQTSKGSIQIAEIAFQRP